MRRGLRPDPEILRAVPSVGPGGGEPVVVEVEVEVEAFLEVEGLELLHEVRLVLVHDGLGEEEESE